MTESQQASRSRSLTELSAGTFDVLVVGGGIVGSGIARDAAMRGFHVGLVEQHDLAFGTSSRSSRLLHGGLRYLAQGRIGLVWEASREKMLLHRIAAHLAQPLPFLFPTYRRTKWPRWQLAIGVKLYDLLCGGQNLGASQRLSRNDLLQRLPGVKTERLTGGVGYYDGLTNDARLVIDTLRSAARHGATIVNYARMTEAKPAGSGFVCLIEDRFGSQSLDVQARVVVNATGPWSNRLPHSSIDLRLTKGIHLVVDRARLPVSDAVVMTEGPRILFAIPWGERVILGTTDTDYDSAPEDVRTDPADVEYVLRVVNESFPAARLTMDDMVSTWAGLRPLIADSRGRPSDISRRHEIRWAVPRWLDVAGGKLTTYRLIAQQAVDQIVRSLDRTMLPCRTAEQPLVSEEKVGASGILPPPLGPEAVRQACSEEWTLHLADLMFRRTGWHYYHRDAGAVAAQAAGWMAESLGWDAARQEAELQRYRESVAHG